MYIDHNLEQSTAYLISALMQTSSMNAHLALQARLHDLEEREKKAEVVRSMDVNEERGELDEHEASAEAEVEVEHMPTDEVRTESDSGEVSECMAREQYVIDKTITEGASEKKTQQGSGDGGHTPGEVWTESPHFLWGL
jgi:hypothetical protein